jgi:hypothetical protein
MDTLTVSVTLLIRMSGLLLFVPDQGTDSRPTHILMPVTGASMPAHVAQVGYRSVTSAGCDEYWDGICYFNVTGYSVRMPASSTSEPPTQLPGAINLTNFVQRRVPRRYLDSAPPPDRVRSRITLPSGEVRAQCALVDFTIAGASFQPNHVVDWTVSDVALADGRLVLVRVPFAGGKTDTILNAIPAADQSFDLFVRQVPETERHHPGPGDRPALGDRADHFHAFYDMLGVEPDPAKRPIPRVSGTLGHPRACPWLEAAVASVDIVPSPTTVNCMVAFALPET